jgi:methylmalonyl-CoA mutase C-terminal domain/subunit
MAAEASVATGRPRPVRVLLAKPGLDGHDRGVKVVAMALRDAGAEVIYLGMRRTPEQIVRAALHEDVDVIGLSILSGAHVALSTEMVAERERQGCSSIPIVVGGTVSDHDAQTLRTIGINEVFPTGTSLASLVEAITALAPV